MKKVIAFFLIAVVAMVAVFAAEEFISLTDTVQLSAVRPEFTNIGFYESNTEFTDKAADIAWGNTDEPESTTYYLHMESNNPGAFDVKIYATGMTRDGDQKDVVPLKIQVQDDDSHDFKMAMGAEDADDNGTEKTDTSGQPITIENFIKKGYGMRSETKSVTFSANFKGASAGSYYGYATVVAAAK